jgi:MFS transporter, CP family, cyanate transporter
LADSPQRVEPALLVIAAGVCAALHVGKLAPAIATLQAALGMSLLQAGFLLSLVQGAGMTLGLAFGALADGLGARRSMVAGLIALGLASLAGGLADAVLPLMLLRAVEGFGFLLVVLPAPGLIRALVPTQRLAATLGLWGTYMPLATALALLLGPLVLQALGWRAWWWALGALSLAMAGVLVRQVPPAAVAPPTGSRLAGLRSTLASPGPWLVAAIFAAYSGQWLAVVGFLPTVYLQAGVGGAATGVLTALVAAANMAGNVASGRALQRGVAAPRLLGLGFAAMGLMALLAFAAGPAPAWLRYGAVLAFSGLGGLIPGTLFSLALRVAPGPASVSTTVGWMQQWSSAGQFVGPPLVAWVAGQAGGWQWTWLATGACCLLGGALSALLARRLAAQP